MHLSVISTSLVSGTSEFEISGASKWTHGGFMTAGKLVFVLTTLMVSSSKQPANMLSK